MSQVLQRAGAILRALEGHHNGRSAGEVAAEVGLPRSTVYRLLKSLEAEHLVSGVSGDGGFRLGPAFMRYSSSANAWLTAQTHRQLQELSRDLDETVDLAVRSGASAYFIDQVAAENRLQAVSGIGLHFPLHCTANGKALLSLLNDGEVVDLLGAELEPLTSNSVVDIDVLLKELGRIRESGLAFDDEEHHLGISAVGTPLENPLGIGAALSVPVPTSRFVERRDELIEGLVAGRAEIEAALRD